MTDTQFDVVIIGAGIAGVATAHYLSRNKRCRVALVDSRQPMSYTSAQSGDNYRNWWPHPTMVAFTNDSIDELDRLAAESHDVFRMTRGGYVLATRDADVDARLAALDQSTDVDVVSKPSDIKVRFPALADSVKNVIHIRRGGDISGQQLGQYMLERIREAGGRRFVGEVTEIDVDGRYTLHVNGLDSTLGCERVVNAAGPFAGRIAAMLGVVLPIKNIYQQKIAFEDTRGAIPRDMPFSIDLDPQTLPWTDEERTLLGDDASLAWLLNETPGGAHCRPEGQTWLKLGWAYNAKTSEPCEDLTNEPLVDPSFPEIVIRRASRLLPALAAYIESPPARMSHYGGYYTMTDENWPLIGPLDDKGAFIVGALSGFGSMSACAAGKLCASLVLADALPAYANDLGLARYANAKLMQEITGSANRGVL